MNIRILVHSKTGTTFAFAQKIQQALQNNGHSVELTRLETNPPLKSGTVRSHEPFQITNLPDSTDYDILLVGCPVWAFSASPVMVELFDLLPPLTGRSVIPFVTMGFPLPGMGGRQAVELISSLAQKKGADVQRGSIIPKMFHNHLKLMEAEAEAITSLLTD